MSSAVKVILGVSVLSLAAGYAGCDSGNSDTGGAGSSPIVVAGSGSLPMAGSGNPSAGSGNPAAGSGNPSAGTSSGGATSMGGGSSSMGGSDLPAGVPLTMSNGWVDGMGNALMIQGAVFTYADDTSKMGMTSNLDGVTAMTDPPITNACIKGTAAKVDKLSTPCATMMFTPPATDCFGQYWGAAIGMNLNQAIDPMTMMGSKPAAFDASALKGFAFNISGMTVPTTLRFKVENATGEFCTPTSKPIKQGANSVLFSELLQACYKISTMPPNPTAETAKSGLLKIAWQVVTKDNGTVPFDFCVSDVRALQ